MVRACGLHEGRRQGGERERERVSATVWFSTGRERVEFLPQ